jgi:secreted PhoX family phosphatase
MNWQHFVKGWEERVSCVALAAAGEDWLSLVDSIVFDDFRRVVPLELIC